MIPFALPTVLKYSVIAIAIAGTIVYTVSAIKDYGASEYDRAKAEDAVQYIRATLKYRKEQEEKLLGVMHAAKEREKILANDAGVARSASDRLRNQLETIRSSLPDLNPDAIRRYADTSTVILSGCSEKYRELAASADQIYS